MNEQQKPFLTPAEAQKEFRLGRDFVRRLIRERKIPCVKLGPRKVLLPHEGIEAFFRQNTIPARREFLKSHR